MTVPSDSSFPGALDAFDAVSGSASLAAAQHSTLHNLAFRAIEKIQAKIGIDGNSAASGSITKVLRDTSQARAERVKLTTSTVAIANNTLTTVKFNATEWGTTWYSYASGTGLLTPQIEGVFLVNSNIQFAANTTGLRQVQIVKNNTVVEGISSVAATVAYAGAAVTANTLIYCNGSSDTIQTKVYHNGGASLDIVGNASDSNTKMEIVYLGPIFTLPI